MSNLCILDKQVEINRIQMPLRKIKSMTLVLLVITVTWILIKLYLYETPLWEQSIDFDSADISNITGTKSGRYLVPNYVHFLRFDIPTFSYVDMICVLAALKNQNPDKIIFHRNHHENFTGRYWNTLSNIKAFADVVEFNYIEMPETILGQPFYFGWEKHHGADVTRIIILMMYGGIFIDNDVYIVRSLNEFRRYEMTLNWDKNQFLDNQVLLAHKDARFLKHWLESYRNAYREELWYYNAGERPMMEILFKNRKLVHRVQVLFGVNRRFIRQVFERKWPGWKEFYTIHLLIHHQYLLRNLSEKATFPVEFNEHNIGYYPNTFREMAYSVYDFANLSWPKLELD